DGRTSRRRSVRVRVGERIAIEGEDLALELARSRAQVLPRLGATPARIALPDGALLVARDFEAVRAALDVHPSRTLAHPLESNLAFVLAALAGIIVAGWFGYRDGLPWAAREIAVRMPPAIESDLARETLAA